MTLNFRSRLLAGLLLLGAIAPAADWGAPAASWLPGRVSLCGTARATEPVDSFLAALRERHYYDEVFDYLKLLESNPNVREQVRQQIPFEQAITLSASAGETQDLAAAQALHARAAGLFEQFLAAHPQHPLAGSAKSQLAGILLEQGRSELRAAEANGTVATVAPQARKRFDQARKQFVAVEKEFAAQLDQMPKLIAPEDHEQQQRKRQISADLAQTRLLQATAEHETARSYPADSGDAKKHFRAAAASYAKLYETYRTRAAGLYARLWEGRCHQELGEMNQALGCFRELMELPDSTETRAIRAKSTRHALECWTDSRGKNYQAAVERGERWEKEVGASTNDADTLAIRYLTALAYQAQSQALPAKDPNRQKLVGFARQQVSPVAQHPGEYQRQAKTLLVSLNTKDSKAGKKGGAGVQNFSEALVVARAALDRLQEVGVRQNAARAADDKPLLEKLQTEKIDASNEAIGLLRAALAMSNSKTPLDEVNSVRYYLCFLYWDLERYQEAAVMGRFLAEHYSATIPGKQGAKIALAASVRLWGEAPEKDRAFERDQIQQIADLTFKQWPDKEEAEEAALTLVTFAAASHQIDQALEYLNKISVQSPRRGQAELRAGQALWAAYLRAARLPEAERPQQPQLDQWKEQSKKVLAQGVERVFEANKADPALASAAFTLAQIALESADPAQALTWLEHPQYGPMTLVTSASGVGAKESFAIETYKLALRAEIAATPPQLKKAEASMAALEKLVKGNGDAKAAENLTAIYVILGKQLQEHQQLLQKQNKVKESIAASQAFGIFLDRVAKRTAGQSYGSLNWVGESYFNLGAATEVAGLATPTGQADFEKAAAAYARVLELAGKDPKYKEQPDALFGVRLRLAECYRHAGKFDEASKVVLALLEEKPMLLTAQVAAAEIFQAKGPKEPAAFAQAITGGAPGKDGKNQVWGWAKISKMTMSDPKYESTFHDARLQMAEARYRYATTQPEGPRRDKVLEAAVQDLWTTYKLRPTLGGAEFTKRYDHMLKTLQKSLKKPETGLEEFKQRESAAAASAASAAKAP